MKNPIINLFLLLLLLQGFALKTNAQQSPKPTLKPPALQSFWGKTKGGELPLEFVLGIIDSSVWVMDDKKVRYKISRFILVHRSKDKYEDEKTGELKSTLKYLLENTSLADTITANCIIQLLFAILFLFWIKSYNRSNFFLASLWILNMVIMAQLLMPITFVSQYATPEINKIIKTSTAGFPTKNLEKPIEMNSKDALSDIDKIGISYYYNKKIGISKVLNSPSSLSEQEQFQLNEPIYK